MAHLTVRTRRGVLAIAKRSGVRDADQSPVFVVHVAKSVPLTEMPLTAVAVGVAVCGARQAVTVVGVRIEAEQTNPIAAIKGQDPRGSQELR